MMSADAELEKMLAKPHFMAEPVFHREQYLMQVTCGRFGQFLRQIKQPAQVFQSLQQMHSDAYSFCAKAGLFIAWGIDLDAFMMEKSGRDMFIAKAKPPQFDIIPNTTGQIVEQVMDRDVLRIQAQPEANAPKPPPGAAFARIKNIGWYAAALIMPQAPERPA